MDAAARAEARQSSPWRGGAAGPGWGLAILGWLYSFLPVRVAYVTLMPLVLYWYWHFNQPREATVLAMRRVGVPWPHLTALQAFWQFGLLMVDKHYERSGKLSFELSAEDQRSFREHVVSPGSLVMLGSHCGAMEAGVSLGEEAGRVIRGVVVHDPSTAGLFNPAAGLGRGTGTIVADGTMASGLRMLRVLRDGDVLGFKADRVLPGTPAKDIVTVDFLGSPADFPRGPAAIVQASRSRALCMELFRTGPGRFEVRAEFIDTDGASAEQITARYAGALERAMRARPDQWFNFYPFWHGDQDYVARLPATVPLGLRAMEASPWAALFTLLGTLALSPVLREAPASILLGRTFAAAAVAALLGLLGGAKAPPGEPQNPTAVASWLGAVGLTLVGITELHTGMATSPLVAGTLLGAFMGWRARRARAVAAIAAALLVGFTLL